MNNPPKKCFRCLVGYYQPRGGVIGGNEHFFTCNRCGNELIVAECEVIEEQEDD